MNSVERARILVIDNDPQVGTDLIEILTPYELSVEFLCTDSLEQKGSLVEDVARTARRFRPHVAVVDVRLLDDYDPDARTVFAVLEVLESAKCILYSAHLDTNVTRRARQSQVVDWISKASAPTDLIQAVIAAAHRQSPRVNAMTIRWPAGWDAPRLLRSLIEDENDDVPETLLDDVVAQVAINCAVVELHSMGVSSDAMPAASRGRSAVLLAQADDLARCVLKLAKSGRARKEAENYEAHVRNRLVGGFHTQLLTSAAFWDVGASLYSLMGTTELTLPTFSDFYRNNAHHPQDILRPLHHFFTKVWAQHHVSSQSLAPHPMFDLYERVFHLEERVAGLVSEQEKGVSHLSPEELSQLRFWLSAAKTRGQETCARPAVTHGDFHGDNLLTDGAHLWVIDFERTGLHHALLDFVELEVDILIRLTDAHALEVYSDDAFFADYLHAEEGDFNVQSERIPADAQKALQVVTGLRKIAGQMCDFSLAEHRLGVFYDAMYVATIGFIPHQQCRRALRLCHALAQALKLG
jgi:FixJ family two-component response regulator